MPSIDAKDRPPDRARRKLGRPPALSEEARCKRILHAAERVFTAAGYGGATMEEVARVAGMSKKTVYALYPDKDCLFAALISDANGAPGGKPGAPAAPFDSVAGLRDYLLAFAEFVLSPRQVRLTRLVISEARHSPRLADQFHARVMLKDRNRLIEGVARVLETEGVRDGRDIDAVATALFGAALGDLHLLALFGKQERFPRKRLLAQIDLAIGLVLPRRAN